MLHQECSPIDKIAHISKQARIQNEDVIVLASDLFNKNEDPSPELMQSMSEIDDAILFIYYLLLKVCFMTEE